MLQIVLLTNITKSIVGEFQEFPGIQSSSSSYQPASEQDIHRELKTRDIGKTNFLRKWHANALLECKSFVSTGLGEISKNETMC